MRSTLTVDLSHGRADVGEISLHYVELGAGDDGTNRPLVLLLHGFPQFWYAWRNQLEPIADLLLEFL